MNVGNLKKSFLNALSHYLSIGVLLLVFIITYIIVLLGGDIWLSDNISNPYLWIIVVFIFIVLFIYPFIFPFSNNKKENIKNDSKEFMIITFFKEYLIIGLSILLTYLFNYYVKTNDFIIGLFITISGIIAFLLYIMYLSKSKK